nr:MAG TPA: hypothetical protein [Crassvirales sp.]
MQRFYRELSVGIAPIVLCKLDFLVQFAVVSDSQSESLTDEDILILLVVISSSHTKAQLYLIARLTANDLPDFRDISLEVVLHSAQLSLSICKVLDGLPLSSVVVPESRTRDNQEILEEIHQVSLTSVGLSHALSAVDDLAGAYLHLLSLFQGNPEGFTILVNHLHLGACRANPRSLGEEEADLRGHLNPIALLSIGLYNEVQTNLRILHTINGGFTHIGGLIGHLSAINLLQLSLRRIYSQDVHRCHTNVPTDDRLLGFLTCCKGHKEDFY